MRSMKSIDLIGHIKFLPWWQLGCSVTFTLQRVWLARLALVVATTTIELAQVDFMVIREDPELHTKMFCEVMVQK